VVGLRRRIVSTTLTFLSIFIAFVLFAVMTGVLAGFDELIESFDDARLQVISRASFSETLPLAHLERISRIDGVRQVSGGLAFPSYYQEPGNSFGGAAVDFHSYVQVLPELKIDNIGIEALNRTRTGATVGRALAERFGWQVGDQIPITSLLLMNKDGTMVWPVNIVSIHNKDPDDNTMHARQMYVNFDYANEFRTNDRDTVHMFVVTVDEPRLAESVALRIDEEFANSVDETFSSNEKQFFVNRMRQTGDVATFVRSILFAVFFTLLFVIGNTMTRSVRQRVAEFGVLKAMGYTDDTIFLLVLAESVALCLTGAFFGLAAGAFVIPQMFPGFPISLRLSSSVWFTGLTLSAGLALVVAIWPALQIRRISVVDAIRRE